MLNELETEIDALCQSAKDNRLLLRNVDKTTINQALQSIQKRIRQNIDKILAANEKDLSLARQAGKSDAFIDRLHLNHARISAMLDGLDVVIELDSPLNKVLDESKRPNGLLIQKVSVPLGVIAVVYEARPNVTLDAAALCLKSGNVSILKPGKESFYSSRAICEAIKEGLIDAGLSADFVNLLPESGREGLDYLITLDDKVDVIVPRGGKALIAHLIEHSRIPLFQHLMGLCHTYIHREANLEKAKAIVFNAKMRRPGICGATETLLMDESIASTFLQPIATLLQDAGCVVRGDETVCQMIANVESAYEEDWATEYLDNILSIKLVKDINEAIDHINRYGSQHTDAIITESDAARAQFFTHVDSAIVMQNASTQFADGYEFGLGAEIGIATGKLHARGPVGLKELTTYAYQVYGENHIRY